MVKLQQRLNNVCGLAARPDLGEGGNLRPVVDLLVEQIECADFVILNKIDQLDAAQLESLKGIASSLNPLAKVLCPVQVLLFCNPCLCQECMLLAPLLPKAAVSAGPSCASLSKLCLRPLCINYSDPWRPLIDNPCTRFTFP